jgi:hypothetical protein
MDILEIKFHFGYSECCTETIQNEKNRLARRHLFVVIFSTSQQNYVSHFVLFIYLKRNTISVKFHTFAVIFKILFILLIQMKKKKTNKQIPLLSPENYIRQRSKNLPLGECFINSGWEEADICNVIITRKHVSGNITACCYLVDLGCLGVKRSTHIFNVPFSELEKRFMKNKDIDISFIGISYELAHNIIHAGIEYAEEYGFKPCKEYSSITSYFLEDDTNDIPLIEIRCGGKDGKPIYVNSGFESSVQAKAILSQLEKTAGQGNYNYLIQVGDEEEDDDEEDDDEEEDETIKEILKLDQEEQERLFVELFSKIENKTDVSQEDIGRLRVLISVLSYNLTKKEEIDEQLDLFETKFNFELANEEKLPNSLFAGIQHVDGETLADLFFNVLNDIHTNNKPKKAIASFRKITGNAPASDLLELVLLKEKADKKLAAKTEEYYQAHPDYFLIQVCYYHNSTEVPAIIIENFEKLLSEQKQAITEFEASFFLTYYAFHLAMDNNTELSTVIAFEEYLCSLDFMSEDSIAGIFSITNFYKMLRLVHHFGKTEEN